MADKMLPGRSVRWVDGFPYPVYEQPYNKQTYAALFPSALTATYELKRMRDPDGDAACGNNKCVACPEEPGELAPGEERHVNKTCAEVAAWRLAQAAAQGDIESFREISDRTIGKPKQITESLNVSATLDEILRELEAGAMPEVETVDAIVEHDWLEDL